MAGFQRFNVNTPSGMHDDTTALALNQYKDFSAVFSITKGTPIVFAANGDPAGAGGVWQIPDQARFVRIHGLTGGNPVLQFTQDSNTPANAAVSAGSMQCVSLDPEWVGLPLGTARSFILDIASTGTVLVTFGW